jgi:hypothetical protein
MTKDEAQRSRWTFYEAVKNCLLNKDYNRSLLGGINDEKTRESFFSTSPLLLGYVSSIFDLHVYLGQQLYPFRCLKENSS